MHSTSINEISVLLTEPLFLSFLYVFCCFTSIYPITVFLRDRNGNKVKQLFCVIPAIVPYGEVFFNFNKFIFVYVVNITFTYDGEISLFIYSGNVIIWDPWILIYHSPVSFVPSPLRRAQMAQSGGKSKSVGLKSQQCSQNEFYYYLLLTFKSLQWLPVNTRRWYKVKV